MEMIQLFRCKSTIELPPLHRVPVGRHLAGEHVRRALRIHVLLRPEARRPPPILQLELWRGPDVRRALRLANGHARGPSENCAGGQLLRRGAGEAGVSTRDSRVGTSRAHIGSLPVLHL